MSDRALQDCLEDMEAILAQDPFPLDPEALDAWQIRFTKALADADRGAAWEDIRRRAVEVHHHLLARLAELEAERARVRAELNLGAQGSRALKGYAPAPRR